jgi:hypothetical protein
VFLDTESVLHPPEHPKELLLLKRFGSARLVGTSRRLVSGNMAQMTKQFPDLQVGPSKQKVKKRKGKKNGKRQKGTRKPGY